MQLSFRETCLQSVTEDPSGEKCLIVAEVAQSHDGSLGQAHAFIDSIADAGADAVKFQTHIAEEESTSAEPWRVKFSEQDETRFEYWKRMEFTEAQWTGLKMHADDRGLLFMSTPFSERAADLLAEIGMKVWKVASGEVGNLPLLRKMIAAGDPIIISSGMSDWGELDSAVSLVEKNGNPCSVLQCTSAYPCSPEDIGLNMLEILRQRYSMPVGLSDHSGNVFAGLAAVTLGAEVLEVHVTPSREMFGPDVRASITTTELRQLVDGVRQIERMIGAPVNKDAMFDRLSPLRKMFTKSVVAGVDLTAGSVLEAKFLKLKKPGTGIPAASLPDLIGRKLCRDIRADELLMYSDVDLG